MTKIHHPVISLTTDFGLADPWVGIMKGVILGRCPTARIVDLCHGIEPGRAAVAGFWLGHAWSWFPPGTIHVAVVDPGVGTDRRLVLIEAEGHRFLAPDNGLPAELLRHLGEAEVRTVEAEALAAIGARAASSTFHGRDLFAPLAAELAAGRLSSDRVGARTPKLVPSSLAAPQPQPDGALGEIVIADRFGNLITNLPAPGADAGTNARVEIGAATLPLARTYGDLPPGRLLALVNSLGLVEIAVSGGSATAKLECGPGTAVRLRLR